MINHFAKIFFVACTLLFALNIKAQTNLVPNPSFESYTIVGCPSSLGTGQSVIVDNWHSLYNTPDYFNTCATNTIVAVPENLLGYHFPASGNAYAGFWTYQSTTPSYHEIIGTQLISPLVVGQKYYVKFMLCLTLGYNSNSGTNKTGIRFTTVQHTTSNPPLLNNIAHVYTSSIITDTTNWTNVFGSFIADSSYSFVEIGNLFDNSHTNIQTIWPDGGSNWSYYYIDDVCISTDSLYSNNWTWTGIKSFDKPNQKNMLYPNPSTDGFVYTNVNLNKDEIFVYDVLGNLVKAITETAGNKIDLNDLQDGIYIIIVNQAGNQLVQKLIIKKQNP